MGWSATVIDVTQGEGDSPKRRARSVFIGEVQFVVCREVSGQDCDRPMASDAEHCGNPDHVRRVPIGQSRGAATFRSRRLERPRLIVDEDYEPLAPKGPPRAFDPMVFSADDIWVATKVQRDFTAYHGTTAEEAVAGVRLVLRHAAARGNHEAVSSGNHVMWWNGFVVTLTPDLGTVVRYKTNHYERTPQMVADGTPSRLRRAKSGRVRGVRQPPPDGVGIGDTFHGEVDEVVNFGAFVTVDEWAGLIHRSEMGDAADARRVLTVGQIVEVEVISLDRESSRVGLRLLGHRSVAP